MRKISLILLVMFISIGCDNFLEQENLSQLTEESFWQNADDARKAIVATYAALQSYNGSKWTFFEHMYIGVTWKSDDILNSSTNYGKSIADFTNGTDDVTFTSFWRSNYAGIAYANQVIENVPGISAMSDSEKTEIIAEAQFLRALYYFHLVVAFENVPLITTVPESPDDFAVEQASPGEVWAQIENDFIAARAGLPDDHGDNDIGRATKNSAIAYLGKVYLFQEKFTEAIAQFNSVIGASYSLLDKYEDNFNGKGENGVESVFEIQWSGDRKNDNDERHPFNYEVTPSALGGWELFYPSDWLMSLMKVDTQATGGFSDRVYASVFFDDPLSVMSQRGAKVNKTYNEVRDELDRSSYFKKYSDDFDLTFYNGININLMRYADILLMQAEALNENGQTDAALSLVNQVRSRSKAVPLATMNQSELRKQIRHHERPVELSMEYTIRWFDLWRWAKSKSAPEPISQTLKNHNKPFADNFRDGVHNIFPIPLSEINVNAKLEQNPGY
ncbi:MAG: RagB/SusD family nutrient uptake outer membrane protein [Ekhidna sp.]|nr:RagB/SusD family nutrient uptake outer membrane protein [Ekhidna sp.]MBC6409475.1 RagB/SusD family nutrient uptake outer membrane protein [Ekhidna sp.]MBC6425839.1 RagB/SusD family nutrient uptake outer membrane protein [Ekhidna sp.]